MKNIIVFDLDGTLAESKQAIDAEMAQLFLALLDLHSVAVISGGDWPQFERQLLGQLPPSGTYDKLYLLPTSGTKFYSFDGVWSQIYADNFSTSERERVIDALTNAVSEAGFAAETIWGEQIEDRGSQITFSGLGQDAAPDIKAHWDPDIQKTARLCGSHRRFDFSRHHQARNRQSLWYCKARHPQRFWLLRNAIHRRRTISRRE
jgi:phosphomannomutase